MAYSNAILSTYSILYVMPFLIWKIVDQAIHLRLICKFQEVNIIPIPTFHLLGPNPFEQYLDYFLYNPLNDAIWRSPKEPIATLIIWPWDFPDIISYVIDTHIPEISPISCVQAVYAKIMPLQSVSDTVLKPNFRALRYISCWKYPWSHW